MRSRQQPPASQKPAANNQQPGSATNQKVMPHLTVMCITPASTSGLRLSPHLYFDIVTASLLLHLASPLFLL
jgi:hypothetical protein